MDEGVGVFKQRGQRVRLTWYVHPCQKPLFVFCQWTRIRHFYCKKRNNMQLQHALKIFGAFQVPTDMALLRQTFRRILLSTHPDKCHGKSGPFSVQDVKEAFELLSSCVRRHSVECPIELHESQPRHAILMEEEIDWEAICIRAAINFVLCGLSSMYAIPVSGCGSYLRKRGATYVDGRWFAASAPVLVTLAHCTDPKIRPILYHELQQLNVRTRL